MFQERHQGAKRTTSTIQVSHEQTTSGRSTNIQVSHKQTKTRKNTTSKKLEFYVDQARPRQKSVSDILKGKHQQEKRTTSTVQVSHKQTTSGRSTTSRSLELHTDSTEAGQISSSDKITNVKNFSDTTTTPGLAAINENKLSLSKQLGDKFLDQTNSKVTDQD